MTANNLVTLPVVLAGICGSDIQKIGNMKLGQLGHEAVCKTDTSYAVIRPLWGCRSCRSCLSGSMMHCQKMGALGRTSAGAFSGTVTVPEDCLYSIDPSIIDVAVLTDPYAVILHGMNLLKHVPGRLAIIGDGIIAQLFLLESIRLKTRVTNCTVFVKDASRIKPMRTLMDKLGADSSYECKTLSDILPDKYDTVIETVGRAQADTINSAIKLAVPRGSIISYGVYPPGYYASIDIRQLLYKEVQLVGSNSFIADEFEQAVSIVQRYSAMFRLLLGESFSSVDLSAAFTAASLKKPGTIPKKIIVTYDV